MFCPRCGEKNPGYAICCSKCGLELNEVQKILEMQAERDPVIARFAETIESVNGNNYGTTQAGPAPREPAPAAEEPVGESEESVAAGLLTAVQMKDRGNEYFKAGKYLDAIDCYEKAIAIDQFFKDAWYNKSIALKKIEREDQAKVCWGIYQRLAALEKKGE
ncbi:MAG TPA: tetratricopeptide repeat protein [Methanoregulaceae archaeon]|nr:tetratricopeptide repeat protein [Methanoregulaceae archaeon]